MIRFISDPEHGEFTASASGNISEVVVEVGVCINTAYNLLRSRDPDAAQCFKQALLVTFRPDSPVWDKEDVPDPHNGIKIVRIRNFESEAHHE